MFILKVAYWVSSCVHECLRKHYMDIELDNFPNNLNIKHLINPKYLFMSSLIYILQNYTYRAALSMMIFFTFIRTPHLFKIALSLISLLFYFLIIFGFLGQSEELRNPKTFFSVSFKWFIDDISLKGQIEVYLPFNRNIFMEDTIHKDLCGMWSSMKISVNWSVC